MEVESSRASARPLNFGVSPLVKHMGKCFHRVLTVPDGPEKTSVLDDLHACLLEARNSPYAEIWVDHGDYPSLCALVNGDRAWLMYLRYNGDAGFSSRNPGYEGPEKAVVHYYLSNGQRDEYPASWAYSTDEVFAALEWFAANKGSPPSITWSNDSGDGNTSPNEVSKCWIEGRG